MTEPLGGLKVWHLIAPTIAIITLIGGMYVMTQITNERELRLEERVDRLETLERALAERVIVLEHKGR